MIEMAMFIGILILGLVFVWKKGDLEWVKPNVSLPKVPVNIPQSAYSTLNNSSYQVRDYREPAVVENTVAQEVTAAPKIAFKPRFKKPE